MIREREREKANRWVKLINKWKMWKRRKRERETLEKEGKEKKKWRGKENIDGRVQKKAMDRKEEEGCNFDDRKARWRMVMTDERLAEMKWMKMLGCGEKMEEVMLRGGRWRRRKGRWSEGGEWRRREKMRWLIVLPEEKGELGKDKIRRQKKKRDGW